MVHALNKVSPLFKALKKCDFCFFFQTGLFTEITTAPYILFTYSVNTYQYLKRVTRDQGLDSFLKEFETLRQANRTPYALGFIDWTQRFFVQDLSQLLGPVGSTFMFKEQKYVIHHVSGPCPLTPPETEETVNRPLLAQLTQELEDFPWGKRGLRLLNYLRDKGVLKPEEDVVSGLPVVDLLKACCNTDPPGLTPGRGQQERVQKILRRFKAQGVLIPRAYLASRLCAAVFWKP